MEQRGLLSWPRSSGRGEQRERVCANRLHILPLHAPKAPSLATAGAMEIDYLVARFQLCADGFKTLFFELVFRFHYRISVLVRSDDHSIEAGRLALGHKRRKILLAQ